MLDYYGIAREKAKHVVVAADDVANAFRQKKVDAITSVGSVDIETVVRGCSLEASRGITGAIQFIDIEEADAIVKRVPALELVEVDQGAFGGRPPRPAESFTTLGFSIRLVTNTKGGHRHRRRIDAASLSDPAKHGGRGPGAGLMEAPDLEEATWPVHRACACT